MSESTAGLPRFGTIKHTPQQLLRRLLRFEAIRIYAVEIVVGTACGFAVGYIASFSLRQSIVPSLLIAALIHIRRTSVSKSEGKGFWIRIYPKSEGLLTDFRMVDGPANVDALMSRKRFTVSVSRYHVLENGIGFSVLDQGLIYRTDHQGFVSRVDFSEAIDPILPDRYDDNVPGHVCGYEQELFIREGVDGYDIGIAGSNSWWEQVKLTSSQPTHEVSLKSPLRLSGEGRDVVELTLATIPYSEFLLYCTTHRKSSHRMALEAEHIGGQRKAFAWEVDDSHRKYGRRFETIEHKYFTVWHGEI